MDKRYRSMDFLRSIAIVLVILAHTILSYGAPSLLAPLQLGGTGVDLFFVLSGWLLGGQLFKESERRGRIDVKRFWVRRWMRTLPAYFAILSVSIAQRYLTKDDVEFPWQYMLFVQNYQDSMEFFAISWSLCVEEQFYLLIAPLLALLCLTNRGTTTATLVVLLALPVIFRVNGWYDSMYQTHVRLDCCVAGVLLAQVKHQYKDVWGHLGRHASALMIGSVALYLMFYVARYFPEIGLTGNPDPLLLAFIFGAFVLFANSSDQNRERFYIPGSNYIATRSYALYLLHPEILAILNRFFLELNFVLYFALAMLGSIIVSEVLYRIVEKPFMDMRERFSFSRSN